MELEKPHISKYKSSMVSHAEQIRQDAKDCLDSKVVQARKMSAKQKFLAGADLFEDACRWAKIGIRNQHPDWNEDQCSQELRRRLSLS